MLSNNKTRCSITFTSILRVFLAVYKCTIEVFVLLPPLRKFTHMFIWSIKYIALIHYYLDVFIRFAYIVVVAKICIDGQITASSGGLKSFDWCVMKLRTLKCLIYEGDETVCRAFINLS